MEPNALHAAYRRLVCAGINHGDSTVVDELIAPGFVLHGNGLVREVVGTIRAGLPDLELRTLQQVAEGDLVASRWLVRGTHRGTILGIAPTGRQVTVTGFSLVRFAGGQVIEEWIEMDVLGLLSQLAPDRFPAFAQTM